MVWKLDFKWKLLQTLHNYSSSFSVWPYSKFIYSLFFYLFICKTIFINKFFSFSFFLILQISIIEIFGTFWKISMMMSFQDVIFFGNFTKLGLRRCFPTKCFDIFQNKFNTTAPGDYVWVAYENYNNFIWKMRTCWKLEELFRWHQAFKICLSQMII